MSTMKQEARIELADGGQIEAVSVTKAPGRYTVTIRRADGVAIEVESMRADTAYEACRAARAELLGMGPIAGEVRP